MVKSGFDLNLARSIRGISNPAARTANEHGQTCFCASDVALAADHFPQMCRSLQRGAQGQTRPVSVYGVRATDLSRKSARHRSLPIPNQALCEVGINAPVANRIRVGQCVARHRTAKTHVVGFGGLTAQAALFTWTNRLASISRRWFAR